MGTPKSLSLFTLFLALAITPQSAVALKRPAFLAQLATVEPVFSIPDSVANGTTIKIGSSSALVGVNEVLEQRFENQFSGTQVDIDYTNSDEALAALASGTIDIAAIGRPLSDAEKSQGYTEVLLGRHKIAIIVSEDNPFAGDVTTAQFAQLFRGEITDWSEIEGGTPGAIRFVDRPTGNDTRQALSYYPVFEAAPFEVGGTADPVDQESTAALVDALGSDGIGFAIADQVINRPGIRILSMHKVLPTNAAYPFSQPMSYVYKGEANPAVQAFLGYVTAPDTADVLSDAKTLGAEATFAGFQGTPNLDAAKLAGLVGTAPGADGSSSDPNSGTTTDDSASDATAEADSDAAVGTDADVDGTSDANAESESSDASGSVVGEGSETGSESTTPNTADSAVGNAESPATSSDSSSAVPSDSGEATTRGKMPWWLLWLIGIPVFGALLWWLLGRRSDDGEEVSPIAGVDPNTIVAGTGAAVAGTTVAAAGIAKNEANQMVMVPRDAQSAYAYWEVSDASHKQLRGEGGEDFGLRLYDVTSWDPDSELPKPLLQEMLDEAECDRHIAIPTPDRDYVTEVGYLTRSDQWLPAARSAPVHVSSDLPPFPSDTGSMNKKPPTMDSSRDAVITPPKPPVTFATDGLASKANQVKGAAIAGVAAAAAGVATAASQVGSEVKTASVTKPKDTSPNRVILVPKEEQKAYAYWEIAEEKKASLQQKGGEKLCLRLYDVTGIDPRTEKPHSVQQFDCNEPENDLHLTVPTPNRTYLADLGYTTAEGKWLRLAHATPVQVPAKDASSGTNGAKTNGANTNGENINRENNGANGKSSGFTMSGMVEGITEKTNDVVQSSKEALGSGASAIVDTAKSATTGTTNTLNSVVDKTVSGSVAAGTAIAATATGVATSMMPTPSKPSKIAQAVQIVLVERDETSAYAYWEIPRAIESELELKDVKSLALRLHEVTNIDLDYAPAHSTQVFDCDVTDRDRHVPIPAPNKDYLAELGYTQSDGTWVKLARSLHIRVA